MEGIRLRITQDGLKAYLQIPQNLKPVPTINELKKFLNRNAVVVGINDKVLNLIAEGRIQNSTVEVARGIPSVRGMDGEDILLIDISKTGKPKLLKNGRVDHQDINLLINVVKNQPLARHIPPRPGKEGVTVSGKRILPQAVSDTRPINGSGTCFSESEPGLLVAQIDGALSINAQGKIEVRNSQTIKGDIDYSTGNINFSGDLQINGNIRAGFSIKVDGSLKIKGSVENARIQCNGDLQIEGGVVGSGDGVIECGGNMKVNHIENFTIKTSGDILVNGDIMHSTVDSGNRIKANQIVGGIISAFFIETNIAGSSIETRTILDIGKNIQLSTERYNLLKKLTRITSEQVSLKSMIFKLVRDSLNDNGKLSTDNENRLEILKQKTIELYNKCNSVQNRIEEIERVEKKKSDSAVVAKELFPNTFVKLGDSDKLIKNKMKNIILKPGMPNVV